MEKLSTNKETFPRHEITVYAVVKPEDLIRLRNLASRFTSDRELSEEEVQLLDHRDAPDLTQIKLDDTLKVNIAKEINSTVEIYSGYNGCFAINYNNLTKTAITDSWV